MGKRKFKTEHTRLGWTLGVVALGTEMILGLTYIFSSDPFDQTFGIITLLEGIFALTGLLLIDIIHGHGFQLKPDPFQPPDSDTIWRMAIILGVFMVIQLTMLLPISIRDYAIAAAIVFAAPAEELFFRGFLLSIFIVASKNSTIKPLFTLPYGKNGVKNFTIIDILGIFISSILFAMLHVNYYGDTNQMIAVFLSGIALGFFYVWWEDLTAIILAHLFLNFTIVARSFMMVSF